MIRRKLVNTALAVVLFAATLAALTACNTIEGIGQDISASARTVKKAL